MKKLIPSSMHAAVLLSFLFLFASCGGDDSLDSRLFGGWVSDDDFWFIFKDDGSVLDADGDTMVWWTESGRLMVSKGLNSKVEIAHYKVRGNTLTLYVDDDRKPLATLTKVPLDRLPRLR